MLKKGKTYLPASREVVDRYVKYSILTFSLQCSGPGPLQGLHGPVVQAQEEDDGEHRRHELGDGKGPPDERDLTEGGQEHGDGDQDDQLTSHGDDQ